MYSFYLSDAGEDDNEFINKANKRYEVKQEQQTTQTRQTRINKNELSREKKPDGKRRKIITNNITVLCCRQ